MEFTIWERMRTEERRLKALQLGLKVSDLEEQETLLETLEASKEVPSAIAHEHTETPVADSSTKLVSQAQTFVAQRDEDEEFGDDILPPECLSDQPVGKVDMADAGASVSTFDIELEEEEHGSWHLLPSVIVDRILIIMGDVDTLGYLARTSKSTFRPSEAVYEHICRTTYPMQTGRYVLNVDRWRNWRNMLIHRPRLRTNGFYTLRTMYTKGYCNDNFWEEKQYTSVEVKFYRHMRFFHNGRVLYSLDITEPKEMYRVLSPGVAVPKHVYEGRYTMKKQQVTVEVTLHYCNMRFVLEVMDGDDGYIGKHNMLRIKSHSSIPLTPLQRAIIKRNHGGIPTDARLEVIRDREKPPFQSTSSTASIADGRTAGTGTDNTQATSSSGNRRNGSDDNGNDNDEVGRVYYSLPIVADLRFHRFWDLLANQEPPLM